MKPAFVIVINGASCAGKTTLAKAIQNCSSEPCLIVSLDQFRDSLPDRYRGMNSPDGTPGSLGLNIVPTQLNGTRATDIRFGKYGLAMLRGMRRAVSSLAHEGLNVVVDDLLIHPNHRDGYVDVLKGFRTILVGVHCNLEEMERREGQREGRFPGTARTTLQQVHSGMRYDIEVDTSKATPHELAERVLKVLNQSKLQRAIDFIATSNR